MAIAKIRNFIDSSLKSVSTPLERISNLEPEIGLRIDYSSNEKKLKVTVLGARHLPQNFGFTRVNSYVVKIKFFPGKEKFETTSKNESWPQWNEEFVFNLRKETKIKFGKSKVTEEEINGSKLIIATLYAVLEDKPLITTDKKDAEKENKNDKKSGNKSSNKKEADSSSTNESSLKSSKLLNQFFGKSQDKEGAGSERKSIDKRRTVGATTIPLDPKNFVSKPPKVKHSTDVSTGEIWKPLKPIASGISGAEDRRENKKGQLEMVLIQEKSDKKDVSEGRLILSISKLRCSLQLMHEQEALKSQLYIKMSVVEGGKQTHVWKSDRFSPCVSMKFAQDQAQVIADNPYEGALKDVTFVVKFVAKNKMGKKNPIGQFVIGANARGTFGEQWRDAMAKPGQPITKWQPFE